MFRSTLFAVVALALMGCSSSSKSSSEGSTKPQDRPGTKAPAAVNGIPTKDLEGTYSGDWGTMHLAFVEGEARVAYDHEGGQFVGTVEADKIRGKWCQPATRGDAEFTFTRKGGSVHLDGRWNDSKTPETWKDDWDLDKAATHAELAARAPNATCR
jgi:hypothetical protein